MYKAIRSPVVPIVVVAGIIRNAVGEVLIARRGSGQTDAGRWEFPGGKLEAGETEIECLVREIREELDLSIDVQGHFTTAPLTETTDGRSLKLSAWFATVQSTDTTPSVHSEVRWVPPTALDVYRAHFSPADLSFLDELVR